MPRSRRGLLALTVSLAQAGLLARIAIGLGMFTTFAAVTMTFNLSQKESQPPLELLPAITAGALAWGAGVMLAFAAAVQALKRDRDDGVRALLRARGASLTRYVVARVGGLAIALAIIVGGGTLAVGAAAILAAGQTGSVVPAAQATAASLVYAFAFSATLAPIAFAALGGRTRAGGYLWLLILIVLPDVFAPWTASVLPAAWGDVVSIPTALASARGALMPGAFDIARLARSLAVLAVLAVLATAYIFRDIPSEDREPAT